MPDSVVGNVQSSDQNTGKFQPSWKLYSSHKQEANEKTCRVIDDSMEKNQPGKGNGDCNWRIGGNLPFSKRHVQSPPLAGLACSAGNIMLAQTLLQWAGRTHRSGPQPCCSYNLAISRPTHQTGDPSSLLEETLPGQPEECLQVRG